MASAWVDNNGGDSKSIKWVEINSATAMAAIQAKRIDGALVGEPYFTQAREGGVHITLLDHNPPSNLWMVNGWAVTTLMGRREYRYGATLRCGDPRCEPMGEFPRVGDLPDHCSVYENSSSDGRENDVAPVARVVSTSYGASGHRHVCEIRIAEPQLSGNGTLLRTALIRGPASCRRHGRYVYRFCCV